MANRKIFIILFSFVLMGWLISISPVLASSTDGTIDSAYKYAWSENIGWINFGTSGGNIHITDSGLTGYGWNETFGWIKLNPSTSGVSNNSEGSLSGYAWGEGVGWIDFSGVNIDSSGYFSGYASGTITGRISFNCANTSSCGQSDFKVRTDWRPRSARPACNNATDDDGDGKIDYPADPGCSSLDDTDETDVGGGGLPSVAYSPPSSPSPSLYNPQGEFKVLINNGTEHTDSLKVSLSLIAGQDTERMAISNFSDFRDAGQETYTQTKTWDLCKGQEDICAQLQVGELTSYEFQVFVKFYTSWGRSSEVVSGSIIYKKEVVVLGEEKPIAELPEVTPPAEKPAKLPIIERVPEILKPLIPEFLKPKEEEGEKPEEMIIIPEQAPTAMQGEWDLLSPEVIEEFVLAPLPKEIRVLAQKFPELGETLKELGITKVTDIEKLKTVKLTLPGLTERVGLPAGVPVAQLSPEIKAEIPTEIVFAKTGGELIDFNIALSVDEKGEPQQEISTISGKPLQLVVKPDKPVKSVRGYVVFKSKKITQLEINELTNSRVNELKFVNPLTRELNNLEIPLQSLLGSLFFALPSFAETYDPVEIETKLVLLEFEYIDPDGDGIYTAEIQAPIIEGEYEIITVMDYEDPELGMKEIRLITVVDPEGYVYTTLPAGKLRISGVIVSIYWLNPEIKQYEPWPAKEYQQENPQTTDDTGKYSFLAPPGTYYLRVEHPNYPVYQSETFVVKEGSGIHMNIELKTKFWWLKIVDWKIIVLILFGALLFYNFYRDKIRRIIKLKS